MASSSTTSYAYQKPSTIATRTLVSGTKPAETVSTSSHDVDTHDRPILQHDTTDHYQQAVAASTVAPSAAGNEEHATTESTTAVKPSFERTQSWKQTDMKRDAMAKILGGQAGGQGYSSTSN